MWRCRECHDYATDASDVLIDRRSAVMPRRSSQRGGAGVEVVESDAASASDVPSSIGCTPEQVDGVKALLAQLSAREDELTAVIERATAEREAVRAEMAPVKDELDALVNAPVSRGRDPTLWLPDELVVMIFLKVPCMLLWGGELERVCQRWRRIVKESSLVKRRKRDERWEAYEAQLITPRVLKGHTDEVFALAVGLDGKIYCGCSDNTIRVWSGVDGAHLQTLEGHEDSVLVLAVGLDGEIYSCSRDFSIRVWSGVDGAHLQTLEGHESEVLALAVGLDGKVYSGSNSTIRVWSSVNGTHLQTLEGHTSTVCALAVGLDSKIYSASYDLSIRMWSGVDGAHLQTLERHQSIFWFPNVLAVGLDGKIYCGSNDSTIRVWSGVDGALLQTLEGHDDVVRALAVGLKGKIFSGSDDGTIRVWSGVDGTHLQTLDGYGKVCALVTGLDGTLYSKRDDDDEIEVW